MEQEMNNLNANDAVMNVKIHDHALLGRMNEEGKYILPNAVIEELIHAKKYLEQKVEDTIYLSCHLTSVEKNLTIMMNYSLIGHGDRIMVAWALVEEVAIADGMITNQLVTSICSNVYEYSEDVLLRAFADFNVYIKDEDTGEERKLYDNQKTALTDVIVKYNIAVQTITDKKIKKLCNKTCAKQLDYLKKKDTAYTRAIMTEIEKGMETYATLRALEGEDTDDIEDKAMLDIINNAVEKVDLTMELEGQDNLDSQKEFHEFRLGVFSDFREETRKLEDEAQNKIVRTASDEAKSEILSMLDVIKQAENSDATDIVNLKNYLSPKAGQTLADMEQHTQHKMGHITDKLSENEGNKYNKIQDYLLSKENEQSKLAKERKIVLGASLNALLGKRQKTVEATELESQTAKVEIEKTGGVGETQISGAKQPEKKVEPKKESKPASKKEEKKNKPAKKDAKPAAPKKEPKKEEEKEKKSEATMTGGSIDAISSTPSNDTTPKENNATTETAKPVETNQKEPEQKEEKEASNTTSFSNLQSALKDILKQDEQFKKENETPNSTENTMEKTSKVVEEKLKEELNIEDEMGQ